MKQKQLQKKMLIFDAGPLINFAMNGLLDILEKLQAESNVEFIITKEVKEEIIDRPLTIKKFELEALRLEALFKRGIIKHANISPSQVEELRVIRNRLIQIADNTFRSPRGSIHLLDKGEAAALALASVLKKYTNQNIPIAIDERTTRILCENPDNLKRLFEKRMQTTIKVDKNNYQYFRDFRVIRSTELAFIAYQHQLIESDDPRLFDSILYALKFHGCSVTDDEIEEMKRIAG